MNHDLTVEQLLLDETFIDYCTNIDSVHRMKWEHTRKMDPQNARVMEEARSWLTALRPTLSRNEIQEEIEKVREQLKQREQPAPIEAVTMEIEQPARNRRIIWWSVAAGLALILGISFRVMFSGTSPVYEAEFSNIAYKTGMGERKKFTLPDGSMIVLKSGSRLRLDKNYNQQTREVELLGEAYFEVASDKDRPFRVHSGRFITTAVGTAFYINGRDPEKEYSMNLVEGVVKLSAGSEDRLVDRAGISAYWQSTATDIVMGTFDLKGIREWVSGQLDFEQTSAAEAFALLQQWYGLPIVDKRKKKGSISITGTFNEQPLEDVLSAICFTLNCKYRIEQQTIIIE